MPQTLEKPSARAARFAAYAKVITARRLLIEALKEIDKAEVPGTRQGVDAAVAHLDDVMEVLER